MDLIQFNENKTAVTVHFPVKHQKYFTFNAPFKAFIKVQTIIQIKNYFVFSYTGKSPLIWKGIKKYSELRCMIILIQCMHRQSLQSEKTECISRCCVLIGCPCPHLPQSRQDDPFLSSVFTFLSSSYSQSHFIPQSLCLSPFSHPAPEQDPLALINLLRLT